MNRLDRAFGALLRQKRRSAGQSQMELARRLGWPQTTVSRVEQGRRGVTLGELADVATAFRCSAHEFLAELENRLARDRKEGPAAERPSEGLSAGFYAALEDEETLLAQLARLGVKFLGGTDRPALVALPAEETLLAALKFATDPRVFEALPALVLKTARSLDWSKVLAGAYSLRLQNRLGMVVAAALQLREAAKAADPVMRRTLESVHERLLQVKLDREEVVGPPPKTDEGRRLLMSRTPDWLKAWHALSSVDVASLERYVKS